MQMQDIKRMSIKRIAFEPITPYINCLSDYLFTLARAENYKLKIKEEIWEM